MQPLPWPLDPYRGRDLIASHDNCVGVCSLERKRADAGVASGARQRVAPSQPGQTEAETLLLRQRILRIRIDFRQMHNGLLHRLIGCRVRMQQAEQAGGRLRVSKGRLARHK